MSSQLDNYLKNMNDAYDEVISNIKSQKAGNSSLTFSNLLLNNNGKIKDYIVHLSIGSGLTDDEENKVALSMLLERHTKFMNFLYTLKYN